MSPGFQTPITIKDAIDSIQGRQYLLPAIQRKFVWSHDQIEMLFDSILRGYPINSFMFWSVTCTDIKSNYKFYEFIKEYRQRYKENNPSINTSGDKDFFAIIDGQQRLTSLYIGLKGTYAYKSHGKWWSDDEEKLPTRTLYLELSKEIESIHDNQKCYNFAFLTKGDLKLKNNSGEFWFKVGDILNFDDTMEVLNYLKENNLDNNHFSFKTLCTLFQKIHGDRLINYYLETEQDSDKVLEVFIRTNSGGTPLSFSNLLMSIASANWKKMDARKEIEELVKDIRDGDHGFSVNQDFILKTCLVLHCKDIRFKLKNFSRENVSIFEEDWERIKTSIKQSFTLMKKIGFNDQSLRSKNAVIPIIYYIHINNKNLTYDQYKDVEERSLIQKWLNLTLLKGIFGGQTDTLLVKLREVIKNDTSNAFPLHSIIDAFKDDPTRNYRFDNEYIERLLKTRYNEPDAYYILALLYPYLDYYNLPVHKDHLHPKSYFVNNEFEKLNIPESDKAFYKNPENWDSILNLQFLSAKSNQSKLDSSLISWVQSRNINKKELLISDNTSLDIKDFKDFIHDRKSILKTVLSELILF